MNYSKIKKIFYIRKYIKEGFMIIIGSLIMACATSFFLIPNQLSSGGFIGIATISYYLLKIPVGTTIFVLNIPLFIISYFRMGKSFVIKSIIATSMLSLFINILEETPVITQDKLLASIYGGIVMGIGSSLTLKAKSSTGGSDLLTYIIRSFIPQYSTSSVIVIIDIIIITLNVIVFLNIEIGLYSAITIFLVGKMIDVVFEGVNFTKIMFIVSSKYEKIAKEIGNKVERGSTAIYAKGMYTNEKKMMLLCVGSRNDVARIKQIALNIDNKAFIIVSNARETWGKGFKKNKEEILKR